MTAKDGKSALESGSQDLRRDTPGASGNKDEANSSSEAKDVTFGNSGEGMNAQETIPDVLSAHLKIIYSGLLNVPVPDKIQELVKKLESCEPGSTQKDIAGGQEDK